ncbi:MAG TPA: hypothetical protein VEK57_13965 [Thermoanaerobaculia bacterium]|nr:hypothetical protein [Thermoanaerobaculia bacterium]
MSDRLVLAASLDIFRNLANLSFLAAAVLLVLAFFNGRWAWTGYAGGFGLICSVVAAVLRDRLNAR